MATASKIDIVAQDIPLHTFRMGLESERKDIPFEYLTFSTAPALAQAAYPHRHEFYEILYVTGGEGTHFIDFTAFPIETDTFYFISPGQVHYWQTTVPLEGEILLFTEDFLLLAPADYMVLQEFSFFHSTEDRPALRLREHDRIRIGQLIQAIAHEFSEYIFRSETVLRAYLHILLVQIQRIYAEQDERGLHSNSQPAPKLVRQFKRLVTKKFLAEQSVQVYANQLGVTTTHLNNTVKSVTGRTPGKLIRQEVIVEAKRLFAHTEMTAAEVGYRLGFNDPSYFSRFFQREVGMSTMQFRQAISENYKN